MARKWIINNNSFKMSASVDYHKDLAEDHSTTKGGGMWEIDKDNKILWLWGVSSDFGKAEPEDIIEAFKKNPGRPDLDNYRVMYTWWLSEKLPDPGKFTEIHTIKS